MRMSFQGGMGDENSLSYSFTATDKMQEFKFGAKLNVSKQAIWLYTQTPNVDVVVDGFCVYEVGHPYELTVLPIANTRQTAS